MLQFAIVLARHPPLGGLLDLAGLKEALPILIQHRCRQKSLSILYVADLDPEDEFSGIESW